MNNKKLLFLFPITGLLLTSCSGSAKTYNAQDYVVGTLQYKENFKILHLSDIHLGNKDDLDLHFSFMSKTINEANADLIVVTGDVFTFADKITVDKVFKFLDSFNTPWTCTFGNHDEQSYYSVTWLTDKLNNFGGNCLFKDYHDDDVFGDCNFVINLAEAGVIKQQIYLLDSNRYDFKKFKGYDKIHEDQIAWYERMVNYTTTQVGSVVPSLAFFHIPLPEFETAYDEWEKGNPEAKKVDADRWEKNEGVAAPKTNTGFFDKMLELGSTKGVFVGHDHINTYCIDYKGIYLGYGIKATNRIYFNENLMGGEIISMDSTNKITIDRIFHTYSEVEGK